MKELTQREEIKIRLKYALETKENLTIAINSMENLLQQCREDILCEIWDKGNGMYKDIPFTARTSEIKEDIIYNKALNDFLSSIKSLDNKNI